MLSNAVATMINEADTFLAVYSEHFSNSSWCPQELEYARNRNLKGLKPKRIILVVIDSSLAPLRFTDALRPSGSTRTDRELCIRRLLESE